MKLDHNIPHGRLTQTESNECEQVRDLDVPALVDILIERGQLSNGFEFVSLKQAKALRVFLKQAGTL